MVIQYEGFLVRFRLEGKKNTFVFWSTLMEFNLPVLLRGAIHRPAQNLW